MGCKAGRSAKLKFQCLLGAFFRMKTWGCLNPPRHNYFSVSGRYKNENKRTSAFYFIFAHPVLLRGLCFFLLSSKEPQVSLFKGQSNTANFSFDFKENLKAITLKMINGGLLIALLFKANKAEGVVCY